MSDERKLKCYKMNDFDWWVDYSLEEAKINYKKDSGLTDDEIDEAYELSDEELNQVFDNDDQTTLRQYLESFSTPGFFASTEY